MLASVGFMDKGVILGATGDVTFNIQGELMGGSKSLIGIVEGDAISKLFILKLLEYDKAGRFMARALYVGRQKLCVTPRVMGRLITLYSGRRVVRELMYWMY